MTITLSEEQVEALLELLNPALDGVDVPAPDGAELLALDQIHQQLTVGKETV